MSTSDAKPKNQTGEQATEPSTQAPQRYNAIIRILAGEGKESISVHKDVLCKGSDFFVKACSKAWLQDEEDKYITDGVVTVEAVDLTTMDLYIHWKYYDKVDISRIHDARIQPTTGSTRKAHDGTANILSEMKELVKLYVAGDYFLEGYHLSNQVISELAIRVERWSNGSPFTSGSIIDYVWDNTSPNATLRSLILDSCSATATMESLLDGSGYPQEFIHDLMLRGIELRDLEPSIKVPRIETHCQYHQHKGEQAPEEKGKCKEWARDAKWSVAGLPVRKLELRAQRPVFPQTGWSLVP
ncbi:Ankyrin repeat and BTB/POZ domain-containing protein 1 [Elasticomyces elasticus]|nr:Ankyrin repeat and BTB/POZ domain-containing protein 1 [Elasticomyces elasticus]KAK3645472.1 Ankyrin repeat and BTB/POZ domain-containing protein 1 [Elasticomyces elasticus]KAK4915828.1 Ankyrin repeat and BTB/POZ domain-containing protein 1 [Elasticomyces elasticus]KAK5755576.1 Ankyrin repeat and BTB/POZ domain-containing protein 1 [Elasticomyces elasticus]